MSFLTKLNPLNWIKEALVSDYVGGLLRHALTAVGFYLAVKGWASQEVADNFVNAAVQLLTSEQFMGGVVALFAGWGSSIVNKRVE